jgi:hypothetical protein
MHPRRSYKSELRVCVRKRIPEGLEELGVALDEEIVVIREANKLLSGAGDLQGKFPRSPK